MMEDIYSKAMRLRLIREGLLRMMQEDDSEVTVLDADAVIRKYTEGRLKSLAG